MPRDGIEVRRSARPPHAATVVPRREPHPATVLQRREPHPATGLARPPHPATVVQRAATHGVEQTEEDAQALRRLQTIAEACRSKFGVAIEVQILLMNGRYYVSANSQEDAVLIKANTELGKIFARHDSSYLREPYTVSESNDYHEAFEKTAEVVVYRPQHNRLHAEQHLLKLVVLWLVRLDAPLSNTTTFYVAGTKCPCQLCRPVLQAFRHALGEIYHVKLVFVDSPGGHGGGGAGKLSLPQATSKGPKSDLYNQFADLYTKTLATL